MSHCAIEKLLFGTQSPILSEHGGESVVRKLEILFWKFRITLVFLFIATLVLMYVYLLRSIGEVPRIF